MNMSELSYDRTKRNVGVIHFGVGAFHRGHQAVYFDDALREARGEWGTYGISPRSAQVSATLAQQNFRYTVNARSGDVQEPRVIGSIFGGARYDLANPQLLSAIHSSELKVITITVTEKAYVATSDPESMPNRILKMLHMRYMKNLSLPTLISCDNLPANGEYLRAVLLESARQQNLGDEFLTTLETLRLPNSMVDRIVPAITPEAIDKFEKDFGYRDESLISTEPYRQWVVAPHEGSSLLSSIRVEISSEVEKFENAKLRLFNGAHSATAYFSQLSQLEYVYEAMAIPSWESFISKLQQQISTSFDAPPSMDVSEYCATARARIGNSAVAHRSAQIAMDGSAKLPQRLFRTINDLAQRNLPRERIAFAIALWIKFLQSGLPVVDPLGADLKKRAQASDSLTAVRSIMETPNLRNPVLESEWGVIASHLQELENFTPIDVAENL